MKSGSNSVEIRKPSQPADPQTPLTIASVERVDGALEKQFIINFDRRCTILLSEEERDALYSSLGDYRATRQLNPLLDRLSQILNSPIKMELVDDIKHFVEERQLDQFEKGMPFGDLSSKVVKILNSTPSYDVRQRSAATTPRSLTPHPIGDWDRRSSKDETGESKRFELTKVDKQQLGFSLWGASDGQGGVFIKHIIPLSIADSAGLKPGDRLLDINDISLDSFSLAQVANLIENSSVLRIRIQRKRASQRLYATPKNLLLREERTRREGRSIFPTKFDQDDKRAATPTVTVSPPSAYVSKTFPDVDKGGTLKEGLFGSSTYDFNPPRSRTGTMSSVLSKIRQIPIKTSGHRPQNSDSLDNVTLKKYESLSSFPLRRTKTVIDLNGKTIAGDSSIRIEEVASNEDHGIADLQPTPIPPPRSSTLPRPLTSTPFTTQHQKSTSLQLLPNPQSYNYQSSTLSSPILGRITKVIPIIRSYIPQENLSKRSATPSLKYAPNQLQNKESLGGIQIDQPQLNLIPPHYEQLFQQIQHPSMQNAELYSSFQQFPPLPHPRSRPHHPSENVIQNKSYSQKPQYAYHRNDTKHSLSSTPIPPERYPDPVFPTVIPHYHATPRRVEDHPYLESDFPHPGMWKSMEDLSYGSLKKKFGPKGNRSKRYLSNPDLSAWSRYGRVYYERESPVPSDLDEYSERSRNNRYNRPFPSGWRSDHDVEYGTTRHHRRGNKYWHYPDRRHEYFDAAQAQFYEDRLRPLRGRESPDQWDDTESEYSDFETVSTVFDSSTERQMNRKFKERPNTWQNYSPFLDVPSTSRSKRTNIYLSNASREVLFKKGASINSEKFRVPIRVDDITSPYLGDDTESSPRTRRSKYDKLENSNRNHKASQRKPSRFLTIKSSNASDYEDKATYVKPKETEKIRTSKSTSKSPKAQPRYHSKTPSISSLSSNFSQTASTEMPLFNSITEKHSELRKEEAKPSDTHQRQSEKRGQADEMSEDEMNAISLLGYSKLPSPGASLRLKPSSAQNHVYQNINFSMEPATAPRPIDDRLPSLPIRSDSQSSATSVRTTKSGHYDFVDATIEFNKGQSKSKNTAYMEKPPTIQTTNQVISATERIFGKGWQAAQIKPVPESAFKSESSVHNRMKQDDSWIKHGGDENSIKPVEQPETYPVIESKFSTDDSKADGANYSKWSLKDGNKTDKGWSENVLNDGGYKSIAIDSADSGVSVETNTISSPFKSSINPPALYPKPVANQSYAIYQNQSFLSRTSGESTDKKTQLNQSNSPQLYESKADTNTPGNARQRHSEIKWRPMVKQRTFDERQKSLVMAENEKAHNLIRVKLDKTFPYLGLSISGGMESRTCPDIIIDNITRGSAADVEGSLKPGMKLISVDGESLVTVTHSEAVRIIKTSFLDKTKRWMDVEAIN